MWQTTHRRYIREGFQLHQLRHIDYSLSWEQKLLLRKYGSWLTALMDGNLTPMTTGQKHFVEVCQGNAKPRNEYEVAWVSYLSTLKDEKAMQILHYEEVKQSSRYKEYFDSLYISGERTLSTDNPNDNYQQLEGVARSCPNCGGTNDDCYRCNGRGYV
jgi:uncharacterized protein YifE (UPF0438 family)